MKKRTKVFQISIPTPCSENWNNMQATDKGKFCASCQKEVVDFSGYTDKELVRHFTSGKHTACGSFHPSQLNTNLFIETTKENHWKRFYKQAAAIIAFLSLEGPVVASTPSLEAFVQPKKNKASSGEGAENVVINGSVKNSQGLAMEGATVSFDGQVVTTTDKDGNFEFNAVIQNHSKISTLIVGYPTMVSVVRNYHPAMQSTSYNVVLHKQVDDVAGLRISGGIGNSDDLIRPTSIVFVKAASSLNKSCKNALAQLATTLRNNPNISIQVTGFAESIVETSLIKKRQEAIRKYLIELEGIADERLKTKIKLVQRGSIDFIEITAYDEFEQD